MGKVVVEKVSKIICRGGNYYVFLFLYVLIKPEGNSLLTKNIPD